MKDKDVTKRTLEIMEAIKKHGEIRMSELAKELHINNNTLRMSVCNCTMLEGSRIYEYNDSNGHVILGWLED